MNIVVGSVALDYFNLSRREPNDIDIWTDDPEVARTSTQDVSLMPTHILKMLPTLCSHALPEAILAIKMSHFGFDIMWEKHKSDILWLKSQGVEPDMKLYRELQKFWKEKHGNKDFLSLYGDKTQFFNDFVEYEFDHDYLHELVALPYKPMYSLCLQEGQEVMIDKEKFFLMPFDDQVRMFREEIAVIALERWLLNPKTSGKLNIAKAHKYALRKTITALTKNWATDFLVENLEHFVKYDKSYYQPTIDKLKRGDINMKRVPNVRELLDDIFKASIACDNRLYFEEFDEDEEEACSLQLRDLVLEGHEFEGFKILVEGESGEGSGENHEYVFSFKGQCYKVLYTYYSHIGCEFDDDEVYLVTPKQVEITQYV